MEGSRRGRTHSACIRPPPRSLLTGELEQVVRAGDTPPVAVVLSACRFCHPPAWRGKARRFPPLVLGTGCPVFAAIVLHNPRPIQGVETDVVAHRQPCGCLTTLLALSLCGYRRRRQKRRNPCTRDKAPHRRAPSLFRSTQRDAMSCTLSTTKFA